MLWPTRCEGNAEDSETRWRKNDLPPGSYWNLWRIPLQMIGLLRAEHALLHKAVTGQSSWVTPAVLFYSGVPFRAVLENVISIAIQINCRLNICMGNLNSWLYCLTLLSTCFNGSHSEDAGKQVFYGQLNWKVENNKSSTQSPVSVSVGFTEATLNSTSIILFWWFQLEGCKICM